jgi:hypothetical protein
VQRQKSSLSMAWRNVSIKTIQVATGKEALL